MKFRYATSDDVQLLARFNQQLIRDESHRNTMSLQRLHERMAGWLAGEYQAVVFEHKAEDVGYALFRQETEFIYLRQFYISRRRRRQGLGHAAMKWLRDHAWRGAPRIRLDVLVDNTAAIGFWRAAGFRDYCLTMEWEPK